MVGFIDRTGEKHLTKEGYVIEIIKYFRWGDCTIQFEDGNILKNRIYKNIVKGNIKNPFHKSICRVGYFGAGKYSRKKHLKIYQTWQSMLQRCYDEKLQEKYPTYKGCQVGGNWYNFQVFAKWFEETYNPETIQGWHLDKDILFKGNKIYSPETCCFIPNKINILFTKRDSKRGKYPIGVCKSGDKFKADLKINNKKVYLGTFDTPEEAFQAYKTAKEAHIKETADEWKLQITEQVYQALINYKVEITA